MTEGEVLQLHNRPATESACKPRNDRSLELIHAGETTAAHAKTLDFSLLSEFSVATSASKPLWAGKVFARPARPNARRQECFEARRSCSSSAPPRPQTRAQTSRPLAA